MPETTETIIRIASEEFSKLVPHATGIDVEELEVDSRSGHFFVTLGYWIKDSKPTQTGWQEPGVIRSDPSKDPNDRRKFEKAALDALINPWRRKFKRVEVDPIEAKAVAIKMYEPPLGVS